MYLDQPCKFKRIAKQQQITFTLTVSLDQFIRSNRQHQLEQVCDFRAEMDKKSAIKTEIYSWRTEDFGEYWKLIGLSHDGIKNGNY